MARSFFCEEKGIKVRGLRGLKMVKEEKNKEIRRVARSE
jgi:hypothetical protein